MDTRFVPALCQVIHTLFSPSTPAGQPDSCTYPTITIFQTDSKTIDCYVMGSKTYETALGFEAKGFGWAYGDKPSFVLTNRELPRTRDTVEFYSGDLAEFVNGRLRHKFRSIWFVGGGEVSGERLRLGLADEVRYSILPILIGDGIKFFEKLDRTFSLHLEEVKAYKSGTVALRYEVRGDHGKPRSIT